MSIEQPEDSETNEEEQLVRVTPVIPYYSYVLVACIGAVYVVQIITGLNRSAMIGGLYLEAFLKYHEYFRILTSAALHGGFAHILFNGYALYMLGRLVETISTRAHLAIVFFISAIGGGVMSLLFSQGIFSVGASGGIIGLLGYLTVYGFYRRKLLSSTFLKNMVFNIAFIGVLGVIVLPLIGSLGIKEVPKIDNLGHLGGLLTGAVYGVFQIPRDLYKDPRESSELINLIGYAALGAFVFTSLLIVFMLFGIVLF